MKQKLKQHVGPIQVLIIEDDARIAEINRRFLEKVEGYQPLGIATNGTEAKELLDILQPDLVLLDIYFPDTHGLELLKYIRTYHVETDVIMITAAKEVDAVKGSIRAGVFDFMIKPLNFQRFQDSLQRYLKFRMKLNVHELNQEIDQEEVDRLFGGTLKKSQLEEWLPKGIDRLTLEKVYTAIKQVRAGLSAEEVAKEIGTSRTTARRYLEFLVSKGELMADLAYGTVGRPERIYLTAKGLIEG